MTRRRLLASAFQTPAPPNIVILFTDDMGYGDLSCYGNPVIRTPHLDRMAAEGIRFTSFYSAAPVCTPSRVGLLTGRHPVRAGQPNNTGPDTKGGLPLSEILLPAVLESRGYRTMAVGKWHLGYQPAEYLPVNRGFDSWFGLPYSNDMIPPWVKTQVPLRLYRDAQPLGEVGDQSNLTELYTQEAVKFINASTSAKQPFFLYLPYSMPHLPISAPERFRGRSRGGAYGDTIETIDWSVGEILAALKKTNADRHTLVFFCSDNGPWHDLPDRMLQKGVEPWYTGSKSLLRGAKGTTWEGGMRVPGIARWPGRIPAGQVTADMASTLDLFPTIAKLAGASLPADRKYDGHDLMPLLRGQGKSGRGEIFYCLGRTLEAVREGPWKYRHGRGGRPELFHLDHDPAELYDRSAREPEIAARLRARMEEWAKEVKAELAGG